MSDDQFDEQLARATGRSLDEAIAAHRSMTLDEAQGAIVGPHVRVEPDPIEVVITADTSALRRALHDASMTPGQRAMADMTRSMQEFVDVINSTPILRAVLRAAAAHGHPIPYKRNARRYGR